MEEHYTVENTVISVVSNINDGVVELLERHFGHFGNKRRVKEIASPGFHSDVLFHKRKPSRTTSACRCRDVRSMTRCSTR